jgi:RNA polymerase sigma-70 factor (ECF subfamily)
VWIEPYPDERLALGDDAPRRRPLRPARVVELAFVAALQHLPPNQRAVLIMREVLGFSAQECADTLDTTSPRSTARCSARARRRREAARAEPAGDAADARRRARRASSSRATSTRGSAAMSPRRRDAHRRRDVLDAAERRLVPRPRRDRGVPAHGPMSMPRRFVPVEANGQVAFGTYLLEDGRFRANAIHLIDFRGEQIRDITAFLDRSVFSEFGLPFYLD